jgi:ABC-type Fe3+-hydroxamate transport system substrate-binding protein/adenosylcobinamide amidohydrolase
MQSNKILFLYLLIPFLILLESSAYGLSFVDTSGREIKIVNTPERVVSLSPAITDIILKVGAEEKLKGVTYHSIRAPKNVQRIGGFSSTSVQKILQLQPDLVFISSLHNEIKNKLVEEGISVVQLEAHNINEIIRNISIVGKIFGKETEAQKIIESIKRDLNFVSRKLRLLIHQNKKRVLRLMGRQTVMAPGDDSFQNDYIRAAGGMPPLWGKKGSIVNISLREWIDFNPEVIYHCDNDSGVLQFIRSTEGWNSVDAVKYNKIFSFPCELTCRASVNAGYFIKWLFSRIYDEELFSLEQTLTKEGIYKWHKIGLKLPYVKSSRIVYAKLRDFTSKALLIEFDRPMTVVSTLEGQRDGILTIGNHYLPPFLWEWAHRLRLEGSRNYIYKTLGLKSTTSSLLFTGADMDNLVITVKQYKQIKVYTLVTAGVRSNALRTSKDEGRFYEPGTINIIILTNTRLSPRAMTRAIITATEAKTAVLQELDIRSSQTPLINQATGTGTDNLIVVEGTGSDIKSSGGHTKMGELIGIAVYEAVKKAIKKQNGIVINRDIFQRLQERGISLFNLLSTVELPSGTDRKVLLAELERLLMIPKYQGFVLSALRLSDYYETEGPEVFEAFKQWASLIVKSIANKEVNILPYFSHTNMPLILKTTFNALITGIIEKNKCQKDKFNIFSS